MKGEEDGDDGSELLARDQTSLLLILKIDSSSSGGKSKINFLFHLGAAFKVDPRDRTTTHSTALNSFVELDQAQCVVFTTIGGDTHVYSSDCREHSLTL